MVTVTVTANNSPAMFLRPREASRALLILLIQYMKLIPKVYKNLTIIMICNVRIIIENNYL